MGHHLWSLLVPRRGQGVAGPHHDQHYYRRHARIFATAVRDAIYDYSPCPLRILAGLAQACQDAKAKLVAETKTLHEQTPAVPLNVSVP